MYLVNKMVIQLFSMWSVGVLFESFFVKWKLLPEIRKLLYSCFEVYVPWMLTSNSFRISVGISWVIGRIFKLVIMMLRWGLSLWHYAIIYNKEWQSWKGDCCKRMSTYITVVHILICLYFIIFTFKKSMQFNSRAGLYFFT